MSSQWECLVTKKLGDDVSGDFASNAGVTRFNGIADFADDMTDYTGDQTKFDANWVTSNSLLFRGNPTNNDIDFDALVNTTNSAIVFDLWSHGIFPGATWALRFELNLSTNIFGALGGDVYIGLTDTDHLIGSATASQSSMGLDILQNNTFKQWNTASRLGTIAVGGGTGVAISATLPTGTPMYWEIKRTDSGSIEVTRFTDAFYTVSLGKIREVGIAGIVNLRYIKIINRSDTTNTGQIAGTIDDVQFFNNTEGITDEFVLHGDEDLEPIASFNPGTATKVISGFDDGNWSVGGGPTVTGGVISGWGADATWRRATYDMLGNDGITLDDLNWTIDFEFLRSDNDNNPSHSPFMLVDTNSVAYNIDPTNALVPFPQNGFVVHYGISFVGNINGAFISLRAKGTASGDFGSAGLQIGTTPPDIPIAQNVTFYMRFMRINGTLLVLEVYTDSNRTTLFDSRTLDLSGLAVNPTNLTWINSSTNTTGGAGRILNGTLGNITIYNGVAGQYAGGLQLNDDFSTYGTPINPDFVDVFNSATGWTTTDSTRVRVEDDQGFLFMMAERDSTNDQIAFDLGATVNPLSNVIFTDDFSYTSQLLANGSWPSTDVALLDPFPNELTWQITGSVEDAIFHDLGSGFSGNFRLRAKIDLQNINASSSVGKGFYWGISDITLPRVNNQNFIGLAFFVDSDVADQKIRLQWTNNQIPGTNQVDIRTSTDVQIYYVEILRTSSTAITVNIYSDAGYTALTDTASAVMSAGVANLRYLKCYAGSGAGGTNTMDGVLDDIEFIDNSQTINENEWLLQFKLSFTDIVTTGGSPKYVLVGLGDKDQTAGTGTNGDTDQDYLGMWFRNFATTEQQIKSIWANNDNVDNGNTGNNMFTDIAEKTFWVALSRDNLELTLRLYDDPNYSNQIESVTETMSAGIINLRYLKVSNLDNVVGGAGLLDVTIDDVCFWNGRSTSCDPFVPTPSFEDDFSTYTSQGEADTAWVPQVANQRVNITTDVLDFVTRRDGVDNRCTHDLGVGNVSNTLWTLRCKYHVDPQILTTNVGSATLVQLQDTDVAQNSQNDMIGFGIQNNVGVAGNRWLLIGKESGGTSGLGDSGNNSVSLIEEDYYIEIARLDAINVRGRVFLNSDFTNLQFEINIVTSSANIDHRYLIISSASDATAWNGTLDGFIDDVQFFNGQVTGAVGSALTPWVSTDETDVFVDQCQENIQYNYHGDGTVEGIYQDLITPVSDAKWVFREKVVFGGDDGTFPGGDAISVAHGLSNKGTGSSNTFQNSLSWVFNFVAGPLRQIYGLSCIESGGIVSGLTIPGSGSSQVLFTTTWGEFDVFYLEIVRESPTLARFTIFSDENYTFPIESHSIAVLDTINDLQFVTYSGRVLNRTGEIIHNIDDVKVWDGVDVADSIDARRYLQMLSSVRATNPTTFTIQPEDQYNLDNDTNYAWRFGESGSGETTFVNQNHLLVGNRGKPVNFSESVMYNRDDDEKIAITHSFDSNLVGAGNAPDRRDELVGKWANQVTKISRIKKGHDSGDTGSFDTDSEAVVFGSE